MNVFLVFASVHSGLVLMLLQSWLVLFLSKSHAVTSRNVCVSGRRENAAASMDASGIRDLAPSAVPRW